MRTLCLYQVVQAYELAVWQTVGLRIAEAITPDVREDDVHISLPAWLDVELQVSRFTDAGTAQWDIAILDNLVNFLDVDRDVLTLTARLSVLCLVCSIVDIRCDATSV